MPRNGKTRKEVWEGLIKETAERRGALNPSFLTLPREAGKQCYTVQVAWKEA